jgi:cbb3-type cytochrome oxidase maturation protein
MNGALVWLVVLALGMGVTGLLAFLWSIRSGQLEDLDGAAVRVLLDDEDKPLRERPDDVVERSHGGE